MPRFSHLGVAAVTAGLMLLTVGASAATATVRGGCEVSGTATSGGIDLTTAPVWHLRSTDSAGGTGTAPSEQTSAQVSAVAFGIGLPIAGGTGEGTTEGSAGPYDLGPVSRIAKVWSVSGSSTSCSGEVTVIIDDVGALATVFGGGGLAAAILAALLLLLLAFRDAGAGRRILGLVIGLVGGIGLGLLLMQLEVLDPREVVGLALPGIGALLGLLMPGLFSREPEPA